MDHSRLSRRSILRRSLGLAASPLLAAAGGATLTVPAHAASFASTSAAVADLTVGGDASSADQEHPEDSDDNHLADRTRMRNYLPGEICVVVACPTSPAPDRLYAAVRAFLDSQLGRLLPAARIPDPAVDPLGYDLAPALLQPRFLAAGQPEVLQPLTRHGGLLPWVVFPRPAARKTVSLLFYRVAPPLGNDDQIVRELVNFINLDLPNKQIDASGCAIEAATPNWLTAAAEHTCGGPGAPPAPVPPAGAANWTFDFKNAAVRNLVDDAQKYRRLGQPTPRSGVVVAVLDTCPAPEQVLAAAAPSSPRSTWLLRDVAFGSPSTSIGAPPSLHDPQDFEQLISPSFSSQPLTPNWRATLCNTALQPHHFLMPDHGLFATGIVRDIAPAAEIHLIRVLGDFGVGDLQGLTTVLSALLAQQQASPGRRLIVNLSLMADVPKFSPQALPNVTPDEQRLLDRWFPASIRAGILVSSGEGGPIWLGNVDVLEVVRRVLDFIHQSLFEPIAALVDQGILIIAAVGNDATARGLHPNPRLPAAYDSVLGVAALTQLDAPAGYTNRGDEAPPVPFNTGITFASNGVAVWGGDATLRRTCPFSDDQAAIDLGASPIDAVRGIFSSAEIPLNGGPNQTGWAYWVGTSFATPVIAGLAADYWATGPALTPAQVIGALRTTFASGTSAALGVPFLQAFQSP
jgi:hypothetical protein